MTAVPPFALEVCVVCVGIFLLMMDCFSKLDKRSLGLAAIAGLLAVFVLSFLTGPMPDNVLPPDFYVADAPALFFKRFILLSTIITIAMGIDYAPIFQRFVPSSTSQAGLGEFLVLPIFTCAGLMWMVSAADFVVIFVSLELVTVSFYVLVASMRRNAGSLEAGVKYLILGALSTGFIVYGITWIFGITGQTALQAIRRTLPLLSEGYVAAILFGLGLVLVSLGFKIAAVPFQFWVPDVYQGAPTPITAFLSVASKAAGFVVLIRVLEPFFVVSSIEHKLLIALTVLAALTLIYGNLAAMPQTNLKRLLGYSSIAHAGYLLIGVASFRGGPSGPAISFYLAGYLLMTFLAFLVLQHVAKTSGSDEISDFNGLGSRSPVLAVGMLIAMLSLAGLPFTVGFLAKFFIFEAAMRSQQYLLVAIGAVTVASGFYYYLKVVRAMYWQPAPAGAPAIAVPASIKVLIGVFCAGIILLGIFPQPLLAMLY
jgi:NADH-quinone oxidoreductase subunit N